MVSQEGSSLKKKLYLNVFTFIYNICFLLRIFSPEMSDKYKVGFQMLSSAFI